MADLTAVILTKNEELNLTACIESVRAIARRIVVVDSGSSDGTVSVARALGADVFEHPFEDYGRQFQWAIDNTGIDTQWIFRLDADERVTEDAAREIDMLCARNSGTDVNGIVFPLEVCFLGKQLRHGGAYPFRKLCIFKRGLAYMEERSMDEQIILKEGRSIDMRHVSRHEDFRDLTYWISKHNWYATRAAKDYFDHAGEADSGVPLDTRAGLRRMLKSRFYYSLPPRLRCRLYFFYRYVLRLGFLDGREGFYYAFFQAYWYRMLIDAKILEAQKTGKELKDIGDLKA